MNARKKTIKIIFILASMIFLLPAFSGAVENKYVVVVDPAHGGTDKGVDLAGDGLEKDITLAVAKALEGKLAGDKKISVKLTRRSDKDLSLEDRIKFAKSAKADLFVSLHVNAGFGRKAQGYEIGVSGLMDPGTERANSKEVVKDMIRNQYLNESVRFAQYVEGRIGRILQRQGRGIRNADFAVLRGLSCPAVVVEMGFATNEDNREKLLEKGVQKELAGALRLSLLDYFKNQ